MTEEGEKELAWRCPKVHLPAQFTSVKMTIYVFLRVIAGAQPSVKSEKCLHFRQLERW